MTNDTKNVTESEREEVPSQVREAITDLLAGWKYGADGKVVLRTRTDFKADLDTAILSALRAAREHAKMDVELAKEHFAECEMELVQQREELIAALRDWFLFYADYSQRSPPTMPPAKQAMQGRFLALLAKYHVVGKVGDLHVLAGDDIARDSRGPKAGVT